MRGWMRLAQSSASDSFDRFGWAVATGDIDMDGDDDVLVGAPYDDYSGASDVGRVYVATAQGHLITGTSVLSQSGTGSDAGASDHFGSSIAVGNNGGFDMIAIGARNETWGNATASAGAVFLFSSSDSGNISYEQTIRAAPASDELTEDAFGTTVATFVDGGRDYVIVGNPNEDANTGNVQVFSATVGADVGQAQLLTQATKGTRAP
jgi:FG-GAP repeat